MSASQQPTFVERQLFGQFCTALERASTYSTAVRKLNQMFPTEFSAGVKRERSANRPCSIYPMVRLLIPDADRERNTYGVKIKNLTDIFINKLMQLTQESGAAMRIRHYKNPNYGGASSRYGSGGSSAAGDFALVLEQELAKRRAGVGGTITIGEVNAQLNLLAQAVGMPARLSVMQTLYDAMSANELKWIVRIILKNMTIGLKKNAVLRDYHEDAPDYYDACNNLKKVLDELTDPKQRMTQRIELYQTFTPMLAKRDRDLNVATIFAKTHDFIVEPKYDGERIVCHWDSTAHGGAGEVKLFTRNANDYTEMYGAALLPWLRRSCKCDKAVLDGEMMSWDNVLHRFGNFGHNKTVMREQAAWERSGRWTRTASADGRVSYANASTGQVSFIYRFIYANHAHNLTRSP